MAIWSVDEELSHFIASFCTGFQEGMIPSCSYAFGAKRFNRMVRLFTHALWIPTLILAVLSVILILEPDKVARIWFKDPEFLEWSKKMLPKTYYLAILLPLQHMAIGFIQSMQKDKLASILSFISYLLPLPIFSSILYFTKKNDPARLFYSYPAMDFFASLLCIFFIIPPIRKMLKEPKDEILMKNDLLSNSELKTTPLISVN